MEKSQLWKGFRQWILAFKSIKQEKKVLDKMIVRMLNHKLASVLSCWAHVTDFEKRKERSMQKIFCKMQNSFTLKVFLSLIMCVW